MSFGPGSVPQAQQTPPGDPTFVNLDPKYQCQLCRNVLRDAVQTSCGHRMCEQCAVQLLKGQPPIRCPGNEESCSPALTQGEIYRDPSARREVRSLTVYCRYKINGCDTVVKWKDLENHEIICLFAPVECVNVSQGCPAKILKGEKDNHESQCLYTPVRCEYCFQPIPQIKLQDHHAIECPRFLVNCQYSCGTPMLAREEMRDHEENMCPQRPKQCSFYTVGCRFMGSSDAVNAHIKEKIEEHLQLVTVFTAAVDLKSMEMRRELQEIKDEHTNPRAIIDTLKREYKTVKDVMDNIRLTFKDIKIKSVGQTERIINLERHVQDLAKKEDVDKCNREIQSLRELQNALSDKVGLLERQGTGGGGGGGGGGNLPPNILHQIQSYERQVGLQDVRLAEFDLRLQVQETASYNGTLMWKIKEYARRKQEAVTGRTLSLYSQPFYTSRIGYKLCARVYLNGDGMGKGTHMSLFFVVMKGEFDALLPFPFQQRVTMKLLDQQDRTPGIVQDITDTFKPDPTSNSFQRPQTEMNIASGCPLFAAHGVIEQRKYLQEDSIFIKFEVDTQDL